MTTIEARGNSGIRDRLLTGILERIRSYRETGDTEAIFSPEAGWERAALIGPNTGVDVEAYRAAGELHWLRYRARTEGDRGDDLMMALRLYTAVLDAPDGGPAHVPVPLRLILESRVGH